MHILYIYVYLIYCVFKDNICFNKFSESILEIELTSRVFDHRHVAQNTSILASGDNDGTKASLSKS